MPNIKPALTILATLLGLCLHAASAQAQLSRTFVSAASGNDANNCDRATPCRTLQGAHDKTNPDGEVTVLDPGGYGGLTITKSISIVNDGVGEASILVSGGANGITINAGAASYVNLRGITIQGIGFGGGSGLVFNSGFALTMENCVVRNHTGFGLIFAPNATSNLVVTNTLVADNGLDGILVRPHGSGIVNLAFNRLATLSNSSNGISMTGQDSSGSINASVTNSVAAKNGASGVLAFAQDGQASTFIVVARSVLANNGTGFTADGQQAAVVLGGSSVWQAFGGGLTWSSANNGGVGSLGDNYVFGGGNVNPFPLARK